MATVGERIAEARAESGITQEQLASAVGLARSALAKIETGARRVSAVELVAIGRELQRRVEWFVEPGPPAITSYRDEKTEPGTQAIDVELDRIVHAVEFVVSHASGLLTNQPEPVTPPQSAEDADAMATEARTTLGLDPATPVHDLATLVATIGLLPFSLHLDAGADAGTVLLATGGVTVINGDQRVGRRRLALAHGLGHYLCADPYTTDWRIAADTDADLLESRLDRFARSLLLPEADLRDRWNAWSTRVAEGLREAAVRAGSHYRVDMSTLARRLLELSMIDAADAAIISGVQTKRADIVEKNLQVHHELEPVALPRVYEQAVLRLYRAETVTEDRTLGLLLGTFDADSLPDLPPAPEGEI